MRAVVQDTYGPPEVLRLEEVARPVPLDDEVLIRIRATTVTQTDTHARAARPFFWRFFAGLRRPKWRTLGVELAGEVEAVGTAVSQFKVGDEVFGGPLGVGNPLGFGAHAEYICISATGPIAHKPAAISFEEAAAVSDGAIQALAGLRAAGAREGQRILIYGATGSLGTAAVQLARHFGAHVTAVGNARNIELVRSLGADEVIDYQQQDFTKNGERYDAIIDAVGKYSYLRARRSLNRDGIYVPTDLGPLMLETIVMAVATRWVGRKRVKFVIPQRNQKDVIFLKELIEAGEYRAVIDRSYPLEQAAEAHRYVETWQKTGNVVLTVSPDGDHGGLSTSMALPFQG